MKYGVDIDSGAMIHIPSHIKICLYVRKWDTQTHRQHGNRISLLYESRLRITMFILMISI
jgi:hypothetical protein